MSNTWADWLPVAAIGVYVILAIALRVIWIRRARREPLPPVVFRGTEEQAQDEAARRAFESGRPVVAVHAGFGLWEFENFVRRIDDAVPAED